MQNLTRIVWIAVGCLGIGFLLCVRAQLEDGAAPTVGIHVEEASQVLECLSPAHASIEPLHGSANEAYRELASVHTEKPQPMMRSVEDMKEHDQGLFAHMNAQLESFGYEPIDNDSRIEVDDIPVFREIVEVAKSKVGKLEDAWLKSADLEAKTADLFARLARGETVGLPTLSKDNPFRRRHPYEVIRQIEIGGKRFVIRVHPDDSRSVLESGAAFRGEQKSQVDDFDKLVRPLFVRQK